MRIPALLAAGALCLHGASHTPTFNEDVAPIVFQHCASCHRAGEAAPFPLTGYADVKKRGAMIAAVTQSRFMPPWHADAEYGDFADARRLTTEQITTLASWVKTGMPEGDPKKAPALPVFTEGWQLGKPDLILTMPAGFDLPASGPDIYRNFVLPLNLPEERWVRAVEFRPSARKVVHHALFFVDPSGDARKKEGKDGKPGFAGMGAGRSARGGSLGGWAVGASPQFLPSGLAFDLPAHSDIVIQTHFHLTGKAEQERSTLGIYFAPRPPEHRLLGIQLPALFGVGAHVDIPAGEKRYVVKDSFTLPVDVKVYGAGAHAHYLGKELKATATLPDGTRKGLLWIKDWDFNWQDQYFYREPFVLPRGTRIDGEVSWDNSAENPHNPSNPPREVRWGEQSTDEMGSVSLRVTCVKESDLPALAWTLQTRTRRAVLAAIAQGRRQ